MARVETIADSTLCRTPNKHARPSRRRLRPGAVDLSGYQAFTVTADGLSISPVDRKLARKAALLDGVMRPSRLHTRTVLDLGANNGYFSLLALQRGASRVIAVDLDADCTTNLAEVRTHLHLTGLDIVRADAADWEHPADCVLALALSHWLCACTARLGSMDALIARLAGLTTHLLVLEFVEAHDPAIESFGHLTWNGQTTPAYSRKTFEEALRRHFRRVQRLGDMSPTRSLYAAFKTFCEVDLSGPLPLVHDTARLLSCNHIATIDDEAQWSAVFDLGDRIVKQTTGRLAMHESRVLALMHETNVPRVLDAEQHDGWSTVTLERIDGTPLANVCTKVASSRAGFIRFSHGCLDLLDALGQAGIVHRDIDIPNIVVRDGLPVLVDFGWAVGPGLAIDAPSNIRTWRHAMAEPGATREHCDVRAMGRMLKAVSGGRHPDLDALFGVMAEPVAALRIVNPALLRRWLTMLECPLEESTSDERGTRALLALADDRGRRLRALAVATATAMGRAHEAHAGAAGAAGADAIVPSRTVPHAGLDAAPVDAQARRTVPPTPR